MVQHAVQYASPPSPHTAVTATVPSGDHRREPGRKTADPVGTFNYLPITAATHPFKSSVECIDHPTHGLRESDLWKFRSCEFADLCFNVNESRYEFLDGKRAPLGSTHNETHAVALGGINPRYDMGHGFDKGSYKVKWFPHLHQSTSDVVTYFLLPDDVVLVPFHSFAGHNVGHLLFDDFYAIYKLALMFGYGERDDNHRWLLIRHVLKETLYASCDIRRNKRIKCMNNFAKFLPMLGVDIRTFSSSKRTQLELFELAGRKAVSNGPVFVCAKRAIAGLGMLQDHGYHDHGWEEQESWIPHNLGLGRTFYNFRNFVLDNLNLDNKIATPKKALQVSFSLFSSRDFDRRLEFTNHINALQTALVDDEVRAYKLWNMTTEDQLRVALQTDVFVSTCGGASMISTFLPRGASLLLFYNATGGLDFANMASNNRPARLDWDLLNNAAHLRVHWLPISTMNEKRSQELFVRLVKHELAIRRNM